MTVPTTISRNGHATPAYQLAGAEALSPLLLTPKQAAAVLQISERLLWDLSIKKKEIPYLKLGKLVRYSPQDLAAWIESQRQGGEKN